MMMLTPQKQKITNKYHTHIKKHTTKSTSTYKKKHNEINTHKKQKIKNKKISNIHKLVDG